MGSGEETDTPASRCKVPSRDARYPRRHTWCLRYVASVPYANLSTWTEADTDRYGDEVEEGYDTSSRR